MKTLIKICGITRAEDAQLCEELGVDYIGLNFVPSSKRCISISQAEEVIAGLKRVRMVGVFADADPSQIREIVSALGLSGVQLHGSETPDHVRDLECHVIKAFRTVPSLNILETFMHAGARILLDGAANGESADLNQIAALPENIRSEIFLAGGLTAQNVSDAISRIHPFAVDCASGVETSPGVKDHRMLRTFISAGRRPALKNP